VSHTQYDHTSVIRTVFDVFQLQGQLTARDGQAASLLPLLGNTLQAAAAVSVSAPAGAATTAARAAIAGTPGLDSGSGLDGYTRIAAQVHHALLLYQAGMQPHELRAAVQATPDFSALPGLPKVRTATESRA
jgi:hypothetical protein